MKRGLKDGLVLAKVLVNGSNLNEKRIESLDVEPSTRLPSSLNLNEKRIESLHYLIRIVIVVKLKSQ